MMDDSRSLKKKTIKKQRWRFFSGSEQLLSSLAAVICSRVFVYQELKGGQFHPGHVTGAGRAEVKSGRVHRGAGRLGGGGGGMGWGKGEGAEEEA